MRFEVVRQISYTSEDYDAFTKQLEKSSPDGTFTINGVRMHVKTVSMEAGVAIGKRWMGPYNDDGSKGSTDGN